ncbi:glycosyltransferase family 4 protein [soil metagenome]
MKVLQLCIRVPFPPQDGGSIAMYNMERSLFENGASVKVLAFNTIKQYVEIEKLDPDYLKMTKIEGIFLDNRIKPFAALLNLFSGESYHIIRFIRRDFDEALMKILETEQFDIIQLESLFMIPYLDTINRLSNAPVLLRTHNVEHLIWKRLANITTNSLRKWYLNLLANRLKRYETWALNRVDGIIALTPEDKKMILEESPEVPVFVAPIGVDASEYHPKPLPPGDIIFHIGAMDWIPNQEGIKWFLDQVWPEIERDYPDVKFRFAGKKMPPGFFNFQSDRIEVKGFIPDAKEYMNEGTIMIVPLFSGSGMRVKIIEGMAMGRAIVTTPVGMEGIHAVDGKHFLMAQDAAEFTKQVKLLIENRELVKSIGANARAFVEEEFDNKAIGKKILGFYEEQINPITTNQSIIPST